MNLSNSAVDSLCILGVLAVLIILLLLWGRWKEIYLERKRFDSVVARLSIMYEAEKFLAEMAHIDAGVAKSKGDNELAKAEFIESERYVFYAQCTMKALHKINTKYLKK